MATLPLYKPFLLGILVFSGIFSASLKNPGLVVKDLLMHQYSGTVQVVAVMILSVLVLLLLKYVEEFQFLFTKTDKKLTRI